MNYAEHVSQKLMQAHRGVTRIRGKLIAFGNDGYKADHRSQREVELLRERLPHLGLREQSFQVSLDGYSWAMVLKGQPNRSTQMLEDLISEVLWEGWFGKTLPSLNDSERRFYTVQHQIALSVD